MTRTNKLDIFVHWQTVKPAKDNPNPKAVKFPINLQQSLKNCSSVAYMAHEIDCKLSWSRLCVLLNECIKDKDQFSAEHDSYQIDHAQFKTNTAVFGVIDTGTGVKFGLSTSNKINKHLKPIQSDVDWAVAINAATVGVLASIYLLTFCAVSTLTMGTFAALYGTFSSYISAGSETVMTYKVEIFLSGLSVFVGVMWLFLLSIGRLHDIFP